MTVRGWVIRDLVGGCLLLAGSVWAPLGAQGQASQPERVALVVGNSDYEDTRVLRDLSNPANDARDIAEVLERLDFRVTTKVNASYAEFREALRQLARESKKATISLLFYAGHGVEVEGVNYLLPVDAELSSYADLDRDGLQLRKDVLEKMSRDGLRLVILDACRNLPGLLQTLEETGTRALSVSNGGYGALPDIQKSKEEILVAYAAAAGEEAYDGKGQRNSPYTAALKAELMQQQDLRDVFVAVRNQVAAVTNEAQVPFEYGSLRKKYFLAGRPKDTASGVTAGPGPGVKAALLDQERVYWESIKDSENPEDFEAYLRLVHQGRFEGGYADLAKSRLQKYRAGEEREEESWKFASARFTLDAFLAYLRDYPKGRFAEAARRHVVELAGSNGLHWAARNNNEEVARVLLDAGAAVDAKDLGMTPLHRAADSNSLEVARVLLEARASVYAQDIFGMTPLHHAASVGAVGVARILLKYGADISTKDYHGWSPVNYAAPPVARVLLDYGESSRSVGVGEESPTARIPQ